MSQDIVSDGLNQLMNAKRAGKQVATLRRYSKVLLDILAIAKLKGYIESFEVNEDNLKINFEKLNACKAIKPRYVVKTKDMEKYVRRYLPSRNIGVVIISTNKGLMTHQTAQEKNIGGSVIAYFY